MSRHPNARIRDLLEHALDLDLYPRLPSMYVMLCKTCLVEEYCFSPQFAMDFFKRHEFHQIAMALIA